MLMLKKEKIMEEKIYLKEEKGSMADVKVAGWNGRQASAHNRVLVGLKLASRDNVQVFETT